ncbi:MAG: transketolase, partial [Sphingomonadales bacterium]
TFRCAEQIRNDVGYHGLAVTTVAVGGGLAYGALGYSHHAVQDYALMRCMPGMTIAAPGDAMEVRACLRWLVAHPGPSYLRIGKAGEPVYHDAVPQVSPGHWLPVRAGTGDRALLSTGAALSAALDRADGAPVYSMPLWGMASKPAQPDQVASHARIETFEDHLLDGGFGTWMLEAMIGHGDLAGRIAPVALDPRVCGMVAGQATLNRIGGLTV